MSRPTEQERMEAYVAALHEAVGALATLKSEALASIELNIPLDPQRVLDVATGRLGRIHSMTV